MKTKDPRDIIHEPVVSEKAYDLIEFFNTYTFLVDVDANKTEIKNAISEIFDVSVEKVNIHNRKGKRMRTGYVIGRRKNTKRALVKLVPDDSIDIFGA